MHFTYRPLRAAAVLLSWALLVSCGGGGGGGSGAGGSGGSTSGAGSPNIFNAVSITLVAPTSVRQVYAENEPGQETSVYLLGSGDLQQLNGKVLYAIVEDPDAITGGTAEVQLGTQSVAGSNALIKLSARTMDKPGHFQGDLKVHACLDAGCATELAGSPLRVPYDITVQRGLTLSRQALGVTVPFGEAPAVQVVDADLPANLTGWRADPSFPYLGVPPNRTQASLTRTGDKGQIDLQLLPVPPGSYQDFVDVSATLTTPRGTTLTQRRSITLTYTVTPNPAIDLVFYPAEANVTVPFGSEAIHVERKEVYNQGIGFSGMAPTVQYLTSPPAAAGHPLVDSWYNETVQYVYPCDSPASSPSRKCLPPGTYTARVSLRYLKGTGSVDVFWPMTLTIAP